MTALTLLSPAKTASQPGAGESAASKAAVSSPAPAPATQKPCAGHKSTRAKKLLVALTLVTLVAVAGVAWQSGLTMKPKPEDVTAYVRSFIYEPDYSSYA